MVDEVKNKHNNIVHTLCLLPSMAFFCLNSFLIFIYTFGEYITLEAVCAWSVSVIVIFAYLIYLYIRRKMLVSYRFCMLSFFLIQCSVSVLLMLMYVYLNTINISLPGMLFPILYLIIPITMYTLAFYNEKAFIMYATTLNCISLTCLPFILFYYYVIIDKTLIQQFSPPPELLY